MEREQCSILIASLKSHLMADSVDTHSVGRAWCATDHWWPFPLFLEAAGITQTWNQVIDAQWSHIILSKLYNFPQPLFPHRDRLKGKNATKGLRLYLRSCHLSTPPCPLLWLCLKAHCLSENQLPHLLIALCLSFLVCKTGVLSLSQRIILRMTEIKRIKCLVQGLALRKHWAILSCCLVRHFQCWNIHKVF